MIIEEVTDRIEADLYVGQVPCCTHLLRRFSGSLVTREVANSASYPRAKRIEATYEDGGETRLVVTYLQSSFGVFVAERAWLVEDMGSLEVKLRMNAS